MYVHDRERERARERKRDRESEIDRDPRIFGFGAYIFAFDYTNDWVG